MMRKPMQGKKSRRGQAVSNTRSLPAPTGGWNARDPEVSMKANYAREMENWFPRTGDCAVRPGCFQYSSGTGILTLMPYAGLTTQKLFAANNSGIYDASIQGSPMTLAKAVVDGNFQYAAINTIGGSFLLAVNGRDPLQLYDGTSWTDVDTASTPYSITGIDSRLFTDICLFKRRIWFVEKNSMSAWYLAVNSIAGAATEFELGQLFHRGGKLWAINSWTFDGGDGPDDYLAFVTTQGEVAVYKGTDPASATTFALVGVYFIGEPLGQRCLLKYGGDLLYLSQQGLYPMSKALLSASIDRRDSLTNLIDAAFVEAGDNYSDHEGWAVVGFPRAGALLVNIPVITTGTSEQYVMNTVTGAWAKFTGWNAFCWCVWKEDLYFGYTNGVAKAWETTSDFGQNISASCATAYSYFGGVSLNKSWRLIRPLIKLDSSTLLQYGLQVDFQDSILYQTAYIDMVESRWDIDIWDTALWDLNAGLRKDWLSIIAREGFCASLVLEIDSTSAVAWAATDFVFEVGGVL